VARRAGRRLLPDGSILVSRAAANGLPDAPARWRSDDLLLGSQLFAGADPIRWTDVAGVAASLLVATALTFATYTAGARIAARVQDSFRIA
jgi:hypothetical protein